jgi:hypothetical protein
MEQRTILVVTDTGSSPSAGPVAVSVDQPAADTTVRGRVRVPGSAPPSAEITVTAELDKPPTPTFAVTDAAGQPVAIEAARPTAPDPVTLVADASGAYGGEVGLRPGRWQLSVSIAGGEAITRRVNVTAGDGLRATLRLDGADSYLEVEEDGTPVQGVSGSIAAAGDRVDLAANSSLRIRAGNAGAVRLTINGIRIGAMGGDGEVVEWRITPDEG